MEWSLQPGVIAWLLVAEVLYVRAVRVLRARGAEVPSGQVWCWHGGIALQAIGLLSPVDGLGDELLSAHMAQHLLIADLAAPLLLAGLRTPVLQFFLPRPVLVPLARARRLRRVLGVLRRPLVAIPVYVLVLYAWHFDVLFEAAVRHDAVHALQHASFVAIGMLIWWAPLEPAKRRVPGALWKIGHLIGARLAGMMLGMAFVLIRAPVYTGVYGEAERRGFSALGDQQTAGGMMIVVDLLIMVFALAYFFWRASEDDALATRAEAEAERAEAERVEAERAAAAALTRR